MDVQPRRYRFRFVNGSNARFYIMQLFNQTGVDMHQNGPPGPAIWQIGSDGGFFNSPVKLNDPANGSNACDGAARSATTVDVRHPGGQVPVPGAGGARRRDRRLRGPGRQDLHAEELRRHPVPQRRPVGFGAPDATSDGLVMQFRVDLPLQGTDTIVQPGGQLIPRCAPRRSSTSSRQRAGRQAAPADPRRGRRQHRRRRRPGLTRRRRRTGREPDQQHQVERQPRGDDHAGSRLRPRTAAACRRPRRRTRARPRSGRSPT